MQRVDFVEWSERIDWIVAVRGAGSGFSVLVISGLLLPIIEKLSPWLGPVWLLLGALMAFVVAALKTGDAPSPPLTGAVAALFAYTLNVPLIYLTTRKFPEIPIMLGYIAAAVVVGAAMGYLMGRRNAKDVE